MNAALMLFLLYLTAISLWAGEPPKAAVIPLTRSHAHNDYEHARPLLDALDNGFCSVEADIWLVGGKLLVAHDLKDANPERTLQALYLEPLRQRTKQNGGRVYSGGPMVLLLIDVKSDAGPTYTVLRDVLKDYSEMLTAFRSDRIQTNAVTILISGNRDHDLLAKETLRHAALDGRPSDLDGTDSVRLVPLISDSWGNHFKWRGEGPFSNDEQQKLRELVRRVHAQGRLLRFWATPDRPEMWSELLRAGVDLINTDNLPGLCSFLTIQQAQDYSSKR